MILCVTPNPCVDKTLFYESELTLGRKQVADGIMFSAGGKGNNVARAVRALGQPAAAFVIVGGPPGQHVVDMITEEDGVGCYPFWVEDFTRTITTVIEEPLQRQTPLFEPGPDITPEEHGTIFEEFKQAAEGARVVTFNGTVPDPRLEELYGEMIPLVHERGAITILDAHGPEFRHGVEAGPYMVKPNIEEAQELLGFALNSTEALQRAAQAFFSKGVQVVCISRGAQGAFVASHEEQYLVTPPDVEAVNPVGSGDAMVAVFAVGLLKQEPLEDIATEAVAAGTANAMTWEIGQLDPRALDAMRSHVRIERL